MQECSVVNISSLDDWTLEIIVINHNYNRLKAVMSNQTYPRSNNRKHHTVMIWSLCLASCLILKSLSVVSSVSLRFLSLWLSVLFLFPPVWLSSPALIVSTCVSSPSVFSLCLMLVCGQIVFVSSCCLTVVLLSLIKTSFFDLNLILCAAFGSTLCPHHDTHCMSPVR